ncbi:MAG TPA: hypothetical protein VF808_10195 [Ktedonobacterales bacterium]
MEIVPASGRGILWEGLYPRLRAEIGAPAYPVAAVIPNPVPDRIEMGTGGRAVVEHGAEEPLRGRLCASGVMDALDQACGKATSSALSAYCDPQRVYLELRR